MGLELSVRGNIAVRPNELALGQVTQGHTHNFDHATYIAEGGFRIRGELPEGGVIEVEKFAGEVLLIRKDVKHQITAIGNRPAIEAFRHDVMTPLLNLIAMLDDPLLGGHALKKAAQNALAGAEAHLAGLMQRNRYECIYAHRTPQGEVVQQHTGWPPAYS